MPSRKLVAPSEIERETGFGKEQLRKWRQRFDFPLLESAVDGKPGYSRETIRRLLLIRRLLEGGFRPGQVVGKSVNELDKFLDALCQYPAPADVRPNESIQAFVAKLRQTDTAGFNALLAQERNRQTLFDFVRYTVAPLLVSIGDSWRRNELDIHHEHLCSSSIERFLHAQILALQPRPDSPCILFAVAPGERHVLGLLMSEAALADHGAKTINFGSNIPFDTLKLAAISNDVDVLALSFSFAYPAREILPTLMHLRRLLPSRIQIWAGGAGMASVRRDPKGIHIFSDFEGAIAALNDLVAQRSEQSPR